MNSLWGEEKEENNIIFYEISDHVLFVSTSQTTGLIVSSGYSPDGWDRISQTGSRASVTRPLKSILNELCVQHTHAQQKTDHSNWLRNKDSICYPHEQKMLTMFG